MIKAADNGQRQAGLRVLLLNKYYVRT